LGIEPEQGKKCTQNFERETFLQYPLGKSRRSEDNIKACSLLREEVINMMDESSLGLWPMAS
jgi:hypothetical protein